MTIPTTMERIPLKTDVDGVVRIDGTRVTLDTIVQAFEEGATAEEIVQQYSSLNLADVYVVIAYYLQRREQVQEYLRERQQLAQQIRKENQARFDARGVRERLLARRSGKRQ
jgi:uncharacterized protein (DUF433 family)